MHALRVLPIFSSVYHHLPFWIFFFTHVANAILRKIAMDVTDTLRWPAAPTIGRPRTVAELVVVTGDHPGDN
jgi:hypothetical protein